MSIKGKCLKVLGLTLALGLVASTAFAKPAMPNKNVLDEYT